MVEPLGVSGRHLDSEPRDQHAHIDEVIVQANQLLEHPESFNIQQSPEMRALRHLNLDSNHMFLLLKRQLGKYYEEKQRRDKGLHPGKSEKWKEVLYVSLFKALAELTFETDKEHQLKGLEHIYKWFLEKTKVELPQIPKTAKRQATPPPRNATVTQDNSIHGRRQRLTTRKMDSVRPIESHSPSPPRINDRSEPLFSRQVHDSMPESREISLFAESKAREMNSLRSSYVHSRLMTQWGAARSRLDERLLAKAEIGAMKPRILVPEPKSEGSDESSTEAASPVSLPAVNNPRKDPPKIDFRHDRARSEVQVLAQEDDFSPLSKIQRARLVHQSLIQSRAESRSPSPDRLSLSFFSFSQAQAMSRPAEREITSWEEAEEGRQGGYAVIADVRRKLAGLQVPCTYRTLSAGLDKPQDLPPDRLNHRFLPTGGEYFTSNPFSPLGKKKSKKGKKKRK